MSEHNPYQSPAAAAGTSVVAPKATLKETLLSFSGRIPRRTYWLWSIVSALVIYAILIPVMIFTAPAESSAIGQPAEVSPIAGILMVILYIPLMWISLALQVKRWHDRGKSGWWWLIGLIPIIGGIWAFVEVGCLRGTVGLNEYGEDPT